MLDNSRAAGILLDGYPRDLDDLHDFEEKVNGIYTHFVGSNSSILG